MSSHDTEKVPLLPVTEPSPVLEDPEAEALRLHEILKLKAQEWRDANNAYQAAWAKTKSGRWVKRINLIVLTIVGGFSFLMISAMFALVVYAAFFDPEDSIPTRNGTNLHSDYGLGGGSKGLGSWSQDLGMVNGKAKVPLEAHIMSKCPDARDCLRDLVLPAMQNVSDVVDFKLSYIGTAAAHDDGVTCMHGPGECLGDMLELCAADLYPDPKTYLGFTMCLSNDYAEIPDHDIVRGCALEHGLDFDKLNGCVSRDDGYGLKLLRDSVKRSADLDVKKSCTVRLNGKTRCVRDGGEWYDCEGGHEASDLIRDILKLKNE